jgi:hypothetical protein
VVTHYFRFSHRGAVNRHRCRLLEVLLARAAPPALTPDWRVDAFHVIAPASSMPGVGAAALCAAGSMADGAVFMATPVHCVAEMSDVRLASDGILSLSPSEALTLCGDFNRVWAGAGVRLLAGRSGELFCAIDAAIDAASSDPEDVRGRHIADHLPTGAGAPRLRQLMSEIEMWLFEHPVNLARRAGAAPVVTGLWLWGGGAGLDSLPQVEGWTAGDDPLFKTLAPRRERPSGMPPTSAVIVIAAEPGTENWRAAESRWLEPSVGDLHAGRIARLALSAGDRCFSVGRRGRWRFVRRRPWWESFA